MSSEAGLFSASFEVHDDSLHSMFMIELSYIVDVLRIFSFGDPN